MSVTILGLVAIVVGYPSCLGIQVWQQSHKDQSHSADAIVVLGAAQYDGRPSPVFQARLDQAAYLYEEQLSRTIIVTGGKQEGDRFTEAEAGANYLEVDHAIPDVSILEEPQGSTTLESLRAVRDIADRQDIESVLLVSDPMHLERIKRIADDLGFETWTSYASYESLNRSRTTKARELLREIASIISYELLER